MLIYLHGPSTKDDLDASFLIHLYYNSWKNWNSFSLRLGPPYSSWRSHLSGPEVWRKWVKSHFLIEEKCFRPKNLFFLTKSFSIPAFYFSLFDMTGPEHTWQKFRPNHPAWKANQFPHSHKCEERKIYLEGKYLLFLSFAYLLMDTHGLFFSYLCTCTRFVFERKKNIFFLSFLMHTHTIYSFLSLCTCTRFILTWKAHTETDRSLSIHKA